MSHQGNPDAPFAHLLRIAEEEFQSLRDSLPNPLQTKLDMVAVLLEDLPTRAQIDNGIEETQLGLFDGAPADNHESPHPRASSYG